MFVPARASSALNRTLSMAVAGVVVVLLVTLRTPPVVRWYTSRWNRTHTSRWSMFGLGGLVADSTPLAVYEVSTARNTLERGVASSHPCSIPLLRATRASMGGRAPTAGGASCIRPPSSEYGRASRSPLTSGSISERPDPIVGLGTALASGESVGGEL
jgi:hypothetical protein